MNNDHVLLATDRLRLSNGKRLRIARFGHGPSIVFLHGYPENLQVWSRVAPLLADRFEVIGLSKVAIYDRKYKPRGAGEPRYYFLNPGDRFDLARRRVFPAN